MQTQQFEFSEMYLKTSAPQDKVIITSCGLL